MKTSLSVVCLIALASSFTAACGDGGGPNPLTGGGSGVGGGDTGSGGAGTNSLFEGSGTWVEGDNNTVGIQGAFYILEDGVKEEMPVADTLMHTDLTADTAPLEEPAGVSKFSPDTVKPCVSGTAVQVTDETGATGCSASAAEDTPGACQWSKQWGGGIGLNLNETGEVDGAASVKSPYNANAAGVKGFTFVASGNAGGAVLRVKVTEMGSTEDFCKTFTIVPNTPVTVQWSDFKHQCWGSAGTLVPDLTNLEALQWQVVTDPDASHEVTNLCIESLSYF